MARGAAVATLVAALALGACGGGEGSGGAGGDAAGGDDRSCPPAEVALTGATNLPPAFPTPDGVVYTATADAGPSTIVDGYAEGGIPDWYETYLDALGRAPYEVRDDEQELRDAEVAFAGEGNTGQVALRVVCDGRVSVRITVRPE